MTFGQLVNTQSSARKVDSQLVAPSLEAPLTDRRRRIHLQVAILAVAIFLCHLPLLIWYGYDELWLLHPQYGFAVVMWVAAILIGYDRARDLPKPILPEFVAPSWIVRSLWAVSIVCLLLATAIWWPRLGAISFLLAGAALMLTFGGPPLGRALIPSGILMLVSIPPPMGLDAQLALKLQGWAVRYSGVLLDLLNVTHAISANVIQVAGRRLLVEEACSGINSMIAIVCFTLSFGFWERRGPWRILVLVVCAVLFVLAANLLRITAGAYLLVRMKIDVFPESIHAITAIALFVITLGLVVSADRFMHFFLGEHKALDAPLERERDEDLQSPAGDLRHGRASWIKCLALLTVFTLLLAGQVTGLWVRGARFPAFFGHSHLKENASFSLPDSIAGWEQSNLTQNYGLTPEMTGRESKAWLFRRGPLRAIVAFDGPFSGFHDLTICYTSAGWTLNKNKKASSPPTEFGVAHASMRNLNVYGDLLFSIVGEEQGNWLDPKHAIDYSATGRFARWTAAADPDPVPSHQIQILTSTYEPLTEEQHASVNALFLASRAELLTQLMEQVERAK